MPSAPAIDEDDDDNEETPEAALVNRAAEHAGGVPALAKALGRSTQLLYEAAAYGAVLSRSTRLVFDPRTRPANDNALGRAS